MTTFHPATNRYAAIAATVAAGPSEAEQRASREALLRRRRHMFTLVEQPDTPAPSVFSISAQQRAVSATTRDDYLADYADAWPTVHDSRDHAALQHRLAEAHGVSEKKANEWALKWRNERGLVIPTYTARERLRPPEVAFLRYLRAHATPNAPMTATSVAEHLGLAPAQAARFVSGLRIRMGEMADDKDARDILVIVHRPHGYYFDEDRAARYPVVVAALEDGTL